MTKVSDTKKLQSVPSKRALWLNSTSDQPTQVTQQVTDKTVMTVRQMNKEIVNLKKDLRRSRFLIQCVKIGRGYFTILREESALKKRQQQLQKLREEELNKFQPAKKFSDTHFRRTTLLTAYEDEKMRKMDTSVIRPFSPVYSSIISSSLPESHVEPLFRQLCALHWLLEALTIDYTHHTMKPLIACWNPKDPGGSKSAIRKINKEKSMGQRWDHFVTAPKGGKGCGVSCQADKLLAKLQSQDKGSFLTDTKKLKVPAMRTASRRLSRRGSTLSLSRTSGASSPQSSMLSVNPGSDEPPSVVTGSKDVEDNESSSTKPEEEILHAHLQKLLEMVREDARRAIMMMMQKRAPSILTAVKQVKSDYTWKEWQSTHRHSERSSTTSGESHIQVTPKKPKGRANRDIIQCKSGVCDSMRAKFYSIAQEAGFCLQDKMEILTKRQEERGLQKFQSFILASNFQKDLSKMRHQVPVMKGDAEEIADHWYFDLLSKLPEDLKNFRPAKRVLTKLQKFGENLDLRIRPHVLLKVLQDLRIWELCSPDIAVAIEFVREHIIHMPSNDYVNWLQGRVNMPIQQQAHPT